MIRFVPLRPSQLAPYYRAGNTIRQCAKAAGMSYNKARRILKLHLSPNEMRPQGGSNFGDVQDRIEYSKRQRILDEVVT